MGFERIRRCRRRCRCTTVLVVSAASRGTGSHACATLHLVEWSRLCNPRVVSDTWLSLSDTWEVQIPTTTHGNMLCSGVFHNTVHKFLEEFDGVTVYMNDIIVWGSAVEEHDERLMKALERLSEVGPVFNALKCVFRQTEIEYLGEAVTQDGVKPDPNNIQAITEMPTPRDVLELQRVLGMVTYLGIFIPNLSVRTAAALRSLQINF